MNETLQLQRLAHEGVGAGIWLRAAEQRPVTLPGQTLATLDVSDIAHPVLFHIARGCVGNESADPLGRKPSVSSVNEVELMKRRKTM